LQVLESTSPEEAATVVKDTLSALAVQKIDLVVVSVNSSTCSTWSTLEALVEAGSVLALGLVGATLEEACEVIDRSKVKPVANFMELHPMNSERKAVGQLMRKVSPLSSAYNCLRCCLL
jgi:diketogulonate reductase-like aldo/keto reductase